jgi:isopenicillin-N N-acyltransferase like protein
MVQEFRAREVTLHGSARQRGRIHGEALRETIQDTLNDFAESIEKGAGIATAELFPRIVHETSFISMAKRWTPAAVEEVLGISEGSGSSMDALFAWQLVQEMAWFPKMIGAPLPTTPACTSLGSCPADGPTVVAQTVDGTGWGKDRGIVMHVDDPDTGIRAHILSWPGLVGVYGLNDCGIGVCCNSMYFDVSNSTSGLTALFTVRGILSQRTFEDADRFIRAVPHASGTNFMVGGPGHTVSYEVSSKEVASYVPASKACITYHTNHALAIGDRVKPETAGWDTNSIARFASARRRMEKAPQTMTWQDAREIISSHDDEENPICRHYQSDEAGMTLWGIVIECSPDPVLHVSTGPPCSNEFRSFGF